MPQITPPTRVTHKGTILKAGAKSEAAPASHGKSEKPTTSPGRSKGSVLNGSSGNVLGKVGGPYAPEVPAQGHRSTSKPLS